MTIKEMSTNIYHLFNDSKKIKASVGASFLLSLTLLFFGPSYIYYGNILEIPYYYSDMVWLFLAYSLAAGLIISIILLFLKGTIHERAVAFVFALGLLFWIQGHILVWDYGVLDGRAINWDDYLLNGIIDSAIWIAVLAFALIKGSSFYKHIALVSVLLLAVQGVGLAAEMYQAPDEPEWKGVPIEIDDDTMFEFSSEQNVIILVLDAFQSDIFQEIIDEDPEYREIFDGFTYYRNAVGGHPTTYPSVTYILTGEHYDNSIPILDHIKNSFSNNSIPKMLKETGYQVDLYPNPPKILFFSDAIASNIGTRNRVERERSIDNTIGARELERLTIFRYVPHFLKGKFYFIPFMELGDEGNPHQDVVFYNSLKSNTCIMINSKVMKFYHIHGAHCPYTINAELLRENLPQNRSGCKEQAKGSLKISGELLAQLKSHGIYDNSMIFIVADHGNSWGLLGLNTTPIFDNNLVEETRVNKNVISSGLPLILMKPFSTNGELLISDVPVTLGDIPQTIMSELNISHKFTGRSILSLNESTKRERKFFHYDWTAEYHKWDKEYLPPIFEYTINGHSWIVDSWKKTYTQYNPQGVVIVSQPTIELGNTILFGINGTGEKYQLDGWSYPEIDYTWTDNNKASLEFQLPKNDFDLIMTITAAPFSGQQRVNVTVNDHPVGEWIFDQPNVQEKSIIIPNDVLNEGVQYIAFELPDAKSPQSLGLSNDDRILALAVQSIVITNSTELIYPEYKYGNNILFGENGTSVQYQLDGWSIPEEGFTWTNSQRSVLGIKSSNAGSNLNLIIRASQFTNQQRVNVTVNNHPVGEWIFDKPGVQEKSIIIPREVLNEEVQYIAFELPDAKSPQSLGLSNDDRILALAVQSIEMSAQ